MAKKVEKRPQKKSSKLSAALPVIGIVVALVLLGWPVVADWISAYKANNTISEMTAEADWSQDPARSAFLAQAQAYNTQLAGEEVDYQYLEETSGTSEIWEYDQQLVYRHPVMMAYLEIPRIGIKVPVYHGTAVDQLAAGAGHLQGTSLPVGGQSSNCVLSAHTGMSAQRMFDDIRFLEVGDTFVIWTLNEPYAYRVYGSDVVEPSQVEQLYVTPGRDLCTLVTCTPYGVNSHRLLVFAERCEYVPEENPGVLSGIYYNSRMRPLLIGIGIVLALGLFLLLWRRRKKKKEGQRSEESPQMQGATEDAAANARHSERSEESPQPQEGQDLPGDSA